MVETNQYGLAYDCRYLQRKDDCSLKEVNHLSFKEKVEWVDRLDTERETYNFGASQGLL